MVTREEVLGSSAVENAPPQKSLDFRLRIFCLVAVQDSNRAALTTPVGRVSNQPSGLLLSPRFPIFRNVYQESSACRRPFAEPRFMQYRTGTMYVRAIRKKQRQGIIVAMVSCLLFCGIKFALFELGRPPIWLTGGNRCIRAYRGEHVHLWQGVTH